MTNSVIRDRAYHALARVQFNTITHAQLEGVGFDSGAIARHVSRAHLVRLHHGVFCTSDSPDRLDTREMAAILHGGHGSALSHLSAARTWKMSRFEPDRIHVVAHRLVRASPGVTYHRSSTFRAECVTRVDGMPATSVARTITDLGTSLTGPQIANVLHEASYRYGDIAPAVRSELDVRGPFRGRQRVLRGLLLHERGSAGTRSWNEDRFIELLQAARVRIPSICERVSPDLDFEVDFLWRRTKLCIEIDGPGHERPRSRRVDAERTSRLEDAGYQVIRIPSRDLYRCPRHVTSLVLRAVDQRRRRRHT